MIDSRSKIGGIKPSFLMASFNRISPKKESKSQAEFIEQFLEKGDHGQTFGDWNVNAVSFLKEELQNKKMLIKRTKEALQKYTPHRDIKVGQRFNRLTIVDFVKKEERERLDKKGKPYVENRVYAICECSCDKKRIHVLPELLRKGDVQSCGCYQKESVGNRFRTHGKTNTREFDLWAAAKERADKYGIDFNIDVEDIVIPEVCPVLGIPINISLGRGRRQPDSPSLDKFYPEKGYVKGNIQVISWRANRIKSDGTPR